VLQTSRECEVEKHIAFDGTRDRTYAVQESSDGPDGTPTLPLFAAAKPMKITGIDTV
jgi:hypothetical protein